MSDVAHLLKAFTLKEMVDFYKQKHPFLSPKDSIRALEQFNYNQPVDFNVLNGETLSSVKERIQKALDTLTVKKPVSKSLNIPEEYRKKLDQKVKPSEILKRKGPKR